MRTDSHNEPKWPRGGYRFLVAGRASCCVIQSEGQNDMVLGFFKRFFGVHDAKFVMPDGAKDITEGLDIEAAIMAHQNWKLRLDAYIEGRSNEDLRPETICFDDRCDLGRWIHSTGKARLGAFPGFTAMTEQHRMFHYVASNVVSLAQSGKRQEAERMLATSYEQRSAAVVQSLQQLQLLSEVRRGAR
jgi:hypothetical protein